MKKIILALVCISLASCTHSLTLMSQNNGDIGLGSANELGRTVAISLNGESYNGNYSYVEQGNVSFSNAYAQGSVYSGARSAYASAYGNSATINQSYVGGGSIIARSESGKGIRCQFSFSTMSRSGAGICQDDKKVVYDLQIN